MYLSPPLPTFRCETLYDYFNILELWLTYLSKFLVPHLRILLPVDVWLVIDDRHEVADDQGKHKVLVHPQTVALQRPAIFVQVSFTLFTFYNKARGGT